MPFISTLIWQGVVVTVIILFRNEASALLKRLARVKHGQTEVIFQAPHREALDASPAAAEALELRDEEGFFTLRGAEELVRRSKYLDEHEELCESILVFQTGRQHTWLVSTNKQIFYILDDERTRASQRLIQYRLPLDSALPVDTESDSAGTEAFQLGGSDWWYYSYRLLGKPTKAKQRLETFVQAARG